jgi:uncharacterized damage-inducible protein DinB
MPTTAALLEEYLRGPQALREAVRGLTPEQQRARPGPGTWSTLEVVGHLADTEALYAERMKRMIAEETPTLLYADETRWVERLASHARDLEEELQFLEIARKQMARILRAVPPECFQRVGNHNKSGPQTVEQVLQKANAHLTHHLGFIQEKRCKLKA